jgi:predicted glycosyltransferase
VDFLGGPALSEALAGSALVLCRSGYSTLMDLARLGKRAVLVPTPGQSEQKYLGELLWRRGLCLCMPQRALCLAEAIKAAKGYPGLGVIQLGNDGEALLSRAVKALLSFG